LAVLTGLTDLRTALASFAHPIIFLFMGGFALAAALHRQGLDRRLALAVLRLTAARRDVAVALLFGLTALLSNMDQQDSGCRDDAATGSRPAARRGRAARAGRRAARVAYSAGIGGIGTLVGSPPNAFAAAQVGTGFAEWLRFGVPLVLFLLWLMVGMLFLLLRPALGRRSLPPDDRSPATPWTRSQRGTPVVFVLTATGWIGAAPLGRALGITDDIDTAAALAAIVALVASGAIGWPDIESRTQWGRIAAVRRRSDAERDYGCERSEPLRRRRADRRFAGRTDSRIAAGRGDLRRLPDRAGQRHRVGGAAGADLPGLGGSAGFALVAARRGHRGVACCAFMLPVATPPNAIVYATEQVPQATMMRCGLVLNAVCNVVITAMATWVFA